MSRVPYPVLSSRPVTSGGFFVFCIIASFFSCAAFIYSIIVAQEEKRAGRAGARGGDRDLAFFLGGGVVLGALFLGGLFLRLLGLLLAEKGGEGTGNGGGGVGWVERGSPRGYPRARMG